MSSPYARTISILRQSSIILSEQMSSVNLYALRSDTVGGVKEISPDLLYKTLKDLPSVPGAVTSTWRDILASVAVPLVKFGQEMARVQNDIKSQMGMLRNTIRLLWIMETIVIVAVLISLSQILSATALEVDPANSIASAGVMVVVLFAITTGFRLWAASLNEQYAEFNHHLNNALVTTLIGYVNSLSTTQVVVVMYSIVTGSDVASEMNRYSQSKYALKKKSECTPTYGSVSMDPKGFVNCEGIPTMITMPGWIAENVPISTLLTIADALIDLKELGVDRFDRAPLWANVRSGVNAVRSVCQVAYDDDDPSRNLTRDAIVSAVQDEIAPILCVTGVQLPKGAFGPKIEAFAGEGIIVASRSEVPIDITGMTLLNPPSYSSAYSNTDERTETKKTLNILSGKSEETTTTIQTINYLNFAAPGSPSHKMSVSQCSRAIIDSGGKYKFGYYDNVKSLCYACGDASVATSSFTSDDTKMAPSSTNNQLIIARPIDLEAHIPNTSPPNTSPKPSSTSNCIGPTGNYTFIGTNGTITVGSTISQCKGLRSPNGRYIIVLQSDGKFVLFDTRRKIQLWQSGNDKGDKGVSGPYWIQYQDDFNLVTRRTVANGESEPIWHTNTGLWNDKRSTRFTMQDDGNAVIYEGDTPKWSTDTAQTLSQSSIQSALYHSAMSRQWAMAATVLDQSEDLQKRLIVVLKRYRFAIDLDANRYLIDAVLSKFYGPSIYESVSKAIDTVLSDLKTSVVEYRQRGDQGSQRYIDVDRLMNKLSSMSNDATTNLSNTFQTLTDASTSYLNLYAPFKPGFPAKVSGILGTYGGGALLIAYATYAFLARTQLLKDESDGGITMQTLIQRIIVATCLLTVFLFVTETMLAQYALRSSHNWVASNDNSLMLVGATVRVNNEFSSLLQTIQTWSGNGAGVAIDRTPSLYDAPRAAAMAFLADCRGVVDKFDACNTITSQQSSMPLPLAEILLHSVVAGAVLVFAAVCVNSMVPTERIRSVGTINRLINRITDGDSSAILEAKSIVECARVPVDLAKVASWMGIVIFAWLTVWFATQSVKSLHRYKASLDATSDCR